MKGWYRAFGVVVFIYVFVCGSSFLYAQDSSVRNLKKEILSSKNLTQKTLYYGAWIPREILNASLYGIEQTAVFLSDPDFIERVEDILYIVDPELLWYPVLQYESGFRPSYGAGILYRQHGVRSRIQASMYDADLWDVEFSTSYKKYFEKGMAKVHVSGSLEKKDDLVFGGLGGDPRKDNRNKFLNQNDEGVFSQDRRQLEWGVLFESSKGKQIAYTGALTRRTFDPVGRGSNDLSKVMDVSVIPGLNGKTPVSDTYHEIAISVDTRKNKEMVTPGFRGEIYSGISLGLQGNKSNALKMGTDIQGFIPTFHEDRILIPRVVFDVTEDLNNKPIPFSGYSKHRTFRGLSSRKWFRNDKISFAPSLEYVWRLSSVLSAHVFYDYVTVGQTLGSLKWNDGMWAAGGGIDLHIKGTEFGRVELSGGSEGFLAKISFGAPVRKNNRTKD